MKWLVLFLSGLTEYILCLPCSIRHNQISFLKLVSRSSQCHSDIVKREWSPGTLTPVWFSPLTLHMQSRDDLCFSEPLECRPGLVASSENPLRSLTRCHSLSSLLGGCSFLHIPTVVLTASSVTVAAVAPVISHPLLLSIFPEFLALKRVAFLDLWGSESIPSSFAGPVSQSLVIPWLGSSIFQFFHIIHVKW